MRAGRLSPASRQLVEWRHPSWRHPASGLTVVATLCDIGFGTLVPPSGRPAVVLAAPAGGPLRGRLRDTLLVLARRAGASRRGARAQHLDGAELDGGVRARAVDRTHRPGQRLRVGRAAYRWRTSSGGVTHRALAITPAGFHNSVLGRQASRAHPRREEEKTGRSGLPCRNLHFAGASGRRRLKIGVLDSSLQRRPTMPRPRSLTSGHVHTVAGREAADPVPRHGSSTIVGEVGARTDHSLRLASHERWDPLQACMTDTRGGPYGD
jgi:hypothetical protein